MTRTNLFTSGDNNVFANKIASDPNVKKVNVSSMLTSLQNRGEDTVQAFKALYNFNDGYFDAATQQGKKVMMLLGTYVSYEQNFDDYANLTEVIYGDDYLYYYKGHPNTPTGMYPQKQEQLDRLGITDVDSSVAAELILFFNPEIGLSGYGSSTYNSASADAAGGLWNSTKSEALKPGAAIDYSIMDWFASPITEDSDEAMRSLCKQGDSCYLVEFSDAILATANYDFAIYSHNSGALTYFKKGESGYDVVKVSRGSLDVLATSHVSNDGCSRLPRAEMSLAPLVNPRPSRLLLSTCRMLPTMAAWSAGRMFPITVGKTMLKREKSPVLRVKASLSRLSKFDLLVRWPIVMTFTIVLMFRIRAGLAGLVMIKLLERLVSV